MKRSSSSSSSSSRTGRLCSGPRLWEDGEGLSDVQGTQQNAPVSLKDFLLLWQRIILSKKPYSTVGAYILDLDLSYLTFDVTGALSTPRLLNNTIWCIVTFSIHATQMCFFFSPVFSPSWSIVPSHMRLRRVALPRSWTGDRGRWRQTTTATLVFLKKKSTLTFPGYTATRVPVPNSTSERVFGKNQFPVNDKSLRRALHNTNV